MSRQYQMFIGGRSVGSAQQREIRSPADQSLVGMCPVGTLADLNAAVEAARTAFPAWSRTSDAERKAACQTVARVVTENAAELARLVTREQGKTLKGLGSEMEIGGCAGWAGFTAAQEIGPRIIEDSPAKRVEMLREPLGVVGSITPWNWPLMIAIWHLAPAIRTGNTVVVKPSPFTPLGTLRLIELIGAALPPGVVNVVAGDDAMGAALSQHPHVQKVIFTGSGPTGRKVMASAAPTLKHLTLELGGNDPGIVLPDADVAKITEPLFWGAFINAGQTCAALKRLYVHDSVYGPVCDALVAYGRAVPMGDGLDENNRLGPLQNERQFRKVADLVDDARRHGGQVLLGGEPRPGPGFFYPVTFVADLSNGVRLVDEEQFGPALPIVRYSRLEDAVAWANEHEFGLGASVWGSDPQALEGVARQLHAGTVYINKHAEVAPNIPFGGVKGSGRGVQFGQEGLEAFTAIKIINAAA